MPFPFSLVLGGYPPAELKNAEVDLLSTIFKSGDAFTVEGVASNTAASASSAAAGPTVPAPSTVSSDSKGIAIKRAIADDNACLFNAVGYVFE